MTLKRRGIEWLQQLETAEKFRRDGHDGTPVVKFAAVLAYGVSIVSKMIIARRKTYIGCTEDRDQNPIVKEFVSVLDNHVRAADQVEIMCR